MENSASAPRLLTLVLLTGLTVLSLNMFVPSLAHIAQALRADYSLVSLAVSGYLGITAIVQLIVGPLSDRFGRRPVLLAALVVFIVGSVGCMLASSIWVFLTFRALQAAMISGWVLALAVIRDTAPEQEAASLMGYVSTAMAVAPMLGPVLGGALDELLGWRSNFVVLAGFGVAVLGLCWVDLGETNQSPSSTFGAQLRSYPELLRSGRFWGYALCMTFSTAAFYVFLAGAPLVATALGVSPAALGFCMGTITAGFALGSFLSGRHARRYRLTTMMIAGRVAACTGLVAGLALFLAGYLNASTLFGATVFAGFGNGLTNPSANAGALSVRPTLAGSASGLSGALIVGGGAVLASITGALLTKQHGAYELLGMMLLCAALGLAAALAVRRIDRRCSSGSEDRLPFVQSE